MNRSEWRQLAAEKVLDAKVLLDAGRWAGAYYIAGYAIECALKACVLARVETSGVIFDDPKFAGEVRTHDFGNLVRLADLERNFGIARGANPNLLVYWEVVTRWSEASRYENKTSRDAAEIFEAITNHPDGVILWVQRHW